MNDLALRPRSSTELVDAAFQVFRRDPIQFMVAAAAVYVPWLVLRLVFDVGVSGQLPTPEQTTVIALGGIVVYAVVGGTVTVIASDVYLGAPGDALRALRAAATRIIPLLVTGVVTLTFIVIGLFLFFVGALYPIARFFAVRQAVMLEDAGVLEALSRSSQLSLGVKRHVLNTLLLDGLITLVITIGASVLSNMIPSRVLANVVATAVTIVIYPLFGITQTLLYYDIRIRKEGFDVEYLATTGPVLGADQPDAPL